MIKNPIPQEYIEDLLVRMAYHSSSIEGNTISLPETISIILENTIPTKEKGHSIREFYEIENHKQAFDYMLSLLESDEKLSISQVKQFHFLLLDRLQHDHGEFKKSQNAIRGAEFETASPQETPQLMTQWVDNTVYRLELSKDETAICDTLAEVHIQFERIHPFSDGNGRVGRLLNMYLAFVYVGAPVIIDSKKRADYIRLLAEQNSSGLAEMFLESIKFEKERIMKFSSKQ